MVGCRCLQLCDDACLVYTSTYESFSLLDHSRVPLTTPIQSENRVKRKIFKIHLGNTTFNLAANLSVGSLEWRKIMLHAVSAFKKRIALFILHYNLFVAILESSIYSGIVRGIP